MLLAGCRLDPTSAPTEPTTTTTTSAAVIVVMAESVVDGDTLRVDLDGTRERVRLLGIDTPELDHDHGNHDCYAAEATDALTALTPAGSTITLDFDVESRDRFGRLLAHVTNADGVHVNVELVRHGYAMPLTIAPNFALADEISEAADDAQRAGAGLWSACS